MDYYNNTCPSILTEQQRTNLILYSHDFVNGWSQEGSLITNNSVTSPEGLLNASILSELATNDVHRTYRAAIAVVSGSVYTYSFFVKKNNVRYVRLSLTQGASTTIWAAAQFDLDTATFTSGTGSGGGVFSNAYITPYGNGWYRIGIAGSIASTSMIPMLVLSNGASITSSDTRGCPVYLGNTSNSLQFYGGQLELGYEATSYIPTTTATVTRNADTVIKSGAQNLVGQTEGTLYCEFMVTDNKNWNSAIIILYGVNVDDRISIRFSASPPRPSAGYMDALARSGGVDTFRVIPTLSGSTIIPTANQWHKVCLTYNQTEQKLYYDGVLVGTRTGSYTQPGLLRNVGIGSGANTSNMNIKTAAIWKTAITDTQAINLTTL